MPRQGLVLKAQKKCATDGKRPVAFYLDSMATCAYATSTRGIIGESISKINVCVQGFDGNGAGEDNRLLDGTKKGQARRRTPGSI